MHDMKSDPMGKALMEKKKGIKLSIMIGPDDGSIGEIKHDMAPDVAEAAPAPDDAAMMDDQIMGLPDRGLGAKMKAKLMAEKMKKA